MKLTGTQREQYRLYYIFLKFKEIHHVLYDVYKLVHETHSVTWVKLFRYKFYDKLIKLFEIALTYSYYVHTAKETFKELIDAQAGLYFVFKSILDYILFNSNLEIKQNETQIGISTRIKGDEFEYKWKNYKSFNRSIVYKIITLLTSLSIKEWDTHLKLKFETLHQIDTLDKNQIKLII
jgi:hypothetical protein